MDFALIARSLPALGDGLLMTLMLTAIVVPIGFCLAIPMALACLSHNRVLSGAARVFIYVFRGTPLLIQLYLIYYGLGQFSPTFQEFGLWWFLRDALYCALLVLVLNNSAYAGEIFRGAIAGVEAGQIEAARAAGMSWFTRTKRIVLPQALRIAWPAYTNEAVFIMQATSLVSLVTVTELFRSADIIAVRSFKIYTMYLTVAVIYLMISYAIIFAFGLWERWLMRHTVPAQGNHVHSRALAILTR